ncbi:MAG: translation initiation factor IF-2 [Gemmatimonadetes bacterium]|nr:translation initiation factor IF-2 [Gemmatimonadota bacterium]
MRVKELAADLKVDTDLLLQFLRELGVRVGDDEAPLRDADVARVLARLEKERRAGHEKANEAMAAAVQDARPTSRRRRRRREKPAPKPEVEAEAEEASEGEGDEAEEVAPIEGAADEVEGEAPAVEDADADGEAEEAEVAVALEAEAVATEAPVSEEEPEAVDGPEETSTAEGTEVSPVEALAEPAEADDGPKPPAPAPVWQGAAEGTVRLRRKPKPRPAASAGPGGNVRIQAEGYTADGRRKRDKKKGKKRTRVDRDAVQENIQRVMAEIKGGKKRRRKGKGTIAAQKEEREAQEQQAAEERRAEAQTVRVNEFLTVAELAELVDVSSTDIIGSAFKNMGLMVTINQRLDFDQIELLLEEFGYKAVRETEYGAKEEVVEEEEDPADLKPRPPVVTVMGHVDHGKTKLLDWVRSTNVVAGEAGGITQHIGAYHVELDADRSITFLDTPGHAAFTAMRARGADVTDLVILVVAADDAVMPQTVEAISHAKNAGVPMIVAINKVDLPAANPMKVKQDLLQHGVTVEEFGGETLVAEVSAKTGQGMDDLLEKVLLQAEILELSANPDREAQGTVIEAQLDVGKGPVATILVQKGTLRVGDNFVCGLYDGRARALLDERGHAVDNIGPGVPVQLLGAAGVPQAGDLFQAMDGVQAAEIAGTRQRLDREKQLRIKERGVKLGDFAHLRAQGEVSTLQLIIKGDVDGSVQAVSDSLEQLSTDEVKVEIVHRGVGAINESDVGLALAAGAVIIGFRVRPDGGARQMAARDDIDIQVYDVIYEAVDDVRAALEGMLSPERREKVIGAAEAREIFKIRGTGTIAGSYVTEGVIQRNAMARIIRDGIVVYDGEIGSLKRFKDDAKEVKEGFECGIGIANFNDVKVGDVIETYQVEEVARTLASSAQGSG